jgi:AbiV family abortive infection protein
MVTTWILQWNSSQRIRKGETVVQLFCSECADLVDVTGDPRSGSVMGVCNHNISVITIPFDDAKNGVEVCLNNAENLRDAAKRLSESSDYTRALFMLLTAYEEMAKCWRILEAATQSSQDRSDLVVEKSVFKDHETKYEITMQYLDYWMPSTDIIWKRFFPRIGDVDTPDLKTERRELRRRGTDARMRCLYVNYSNGWVNTLSVSKERVERNRKMLDHMIGGFRSSLSNWETAISVP